MCGGRNANTERQIMAEPIDLTQQALTALAAVNTMKTEEES